MAKEKFAKGGRVLADHKKVGKRLIPPLMQLPNIKEFSFRDGTLPNLVWISAFFLRNSDRRAVNDTVEFLRNCETALTEAHAENSEPAPKPPPLAFLNNFNRLSVEQKAAVRSATHESGRLAAIRDTLLHQYLILERYPLAFLFDERPSGFDRAAAIGRLKEDVDHLLDRYSLHATKVQTTALVSMMATGKLFFSSSIDVPDFNAIFRDPSSEESQRVASFARGNLNAGAGMSDEASENGWSRDFWDQAFRLDECT